MARHLLRLMLLVCLMSVCAQVSSAKKPNPNTFVGTFTVNIRGYWNGQGTATVTATTVQIQATLTDEGGNVGTLTTDILNVTDGHFTGAGTVFAVPMTINGRVEAKDPPPAKGKAKGKTKNSDDSDQVLTDARLGATFVANSHTGRIAGGRD